MPDMAPIDPVLGIFCLGCENEQVTDDEYEVQPATVWGPDGEPYCDEHKPSPGDMVQCPSCGKWVWDGNFMRQSNGTLRCFFCD